MGGNGRDSRGSGRGRRLVVAGAAVAATAALFLVLWGQADRGSVLTRVPVLDEAYYLREGRAIADGQWVPPGPFVMSPLYPYLVAATGSGREFEAHGARHGPPPHGLRALQAAVWLATALLLRLTARRLLPDPWAWLPPALFVLYAPAAVFVTTSLLEIPLTGAVTAALWLLTPRADGSAPPGARSATAAAGVGLLIGLAALLRPTAALLLLPAALAVAAWPSPPGRAVAGDPRARRRAARGLLALAAGALLALGPAIAHNTARTGRLAGISLNGGLNLYVGQGKGANGFFRTFVGLDFETDPAGVAFLSQRLGRRLDGPGEADRVWLQEALAWMKDHPAAAAGLWARKVWLHFTAPEIDQVTPLEAWRRDAPILRALPVPYGLLAALGLAGAPLVWRRRPWRPWLLAMALIVAAQSLFFVVSRYRLVLVPGLALLAAAWAHALFVRRGRGRILPAGLALAGALAAVPWGLGAQRTAWTALAAANEARRWERLTEPGAAERAESLYRAAQAADPTQSQAVQGLARVLVRAGRAQEAAQVLAAGALRADQPWLLERDLGFVLIQLGRPAEALPRLASALRERPDDAEMLHASVVALDALGRTSEAADAARRFVTACPGDPRGYVNLGVLLARTGRRDEARAVFQEALRRWPGDAQLRHNLQVLEAEAPGPPADRSHAR